MKKSWSYKKAGVDIEAAEKAISSIRGLAKKTERKEVISGIGGFSALFDLSSLGYKYPVLVSSTDGVGTKIKIAQAVNKHNTVGIDLVAMVVNDLLTCGAKPIFFLDYIACGKVKPGLIEEILRGVIEGCRLAECSLIGGETAEMPDFYKKNEYDLAGFGVGVVEKKKIINGKKIKEGDLILGLASSGLHSNGFSLVRKLLKTEKIDFQEKTPFSKKSWAEVLLTPTKIYARSLLALLEKVEVKGLAHITGGGLTLNLPRILPPNKRAIIRMDSWKIPKIFDWLQRAGNIGLEEMFKTFNMGIGMAIIVSPGDFELARKILEEKGEKVFLIGKIERGLAGVSYQS